jgi:DNA-binding NtrC family response regulator
MKVKGKIFLVDDDNLIATMLTKVLKNAGYEVNYQTDTKDLISNIKKFSPDLVMLDINLPDRNGIDILKEIKERDKTIEVVMLTADETAETAVKAMKLGAADYITKPFNMDEVKIVISNIMEKRQIKKELDYLRKVSIEPFEREIIAKSSVMTELLNKVKRIAQAGVSTLLIVGESGTGKELMARYAHRLLHSDYLSNYAPFIAINCAAMPESLLESELFGYEKGAFTDAKFDKKGLFELADRGSLLLDEIGEMKLNLQSKLLRVLEERTVRRIGGKEDISVDVTVIATTNKDLQEAVSKGEFRMDLFYRLNAFSIQIPPLRDRKEDIDLLAQHFLHDFAKRYKNSNIKGISKEALELLKSYSWPGNIRELRNVIERIVVLENSEFILPEHLPKEITMKNKDIKSTERFILPDTGISLEDVEKDLIIQALEKAKNNRVVAAKLLNISYDSLRYQIKKFGLD